MGSGEMFATFPESFVRTMRLVFALVVDFHMSFERELFLSISNALLGCVGAPRIGNA
jgi:hypothetical protein